MVWWQGKKCCHVTAPLSEKEKKLLFLLSDSFFSVLYQLGYGMWKREFP
jgi:hypothetical protein